MRILITIALRNLLRNRRRTIITITAIAFSLGTLIFLRNFMYGAQTQMTNNIKSTLTSDLQVIPKSQENIYNVNGSIENPQAIRNFLKNDSRIKGSVSEIVATGLVAGETDSMATFIVGYHPEEERAMGNTPPPIVHGHPLQIGASGSMIMGEPMRDSLGLAIGDSVVLTGQDYYGSLVGRRFTLVGTFKTGNDQLDYGNVLILYDEARDLLSFGDHASKILVNVKHEDDIPAVVSALKQQTDSKTISVMTWEELIPMLAQMIEFQNGMIFIVVMVILAIVTAGILNTMLMSVTERVPEFGLMMAMGTPPSHVIALVMLEGTLIALTGSIVGMAIGVSTTVITGHYGLDLSWFTSALSNLLIGSTVYPRVDTTNLGIFVSIIIVGTMLVSWIPAWRAARLSPITAMRQVG
jgi:ABC-type lipoprotein release transport system permease subunit